MRSRRLPRRIAVLLFLALTPLALGAVIAMERAEIVFAGQRPQNATWSDNLTLSDVGLVAPKPEEKVSREVWVQTDEIAVGRAWRPPTGARLRLSLHGEVPQVPRAFVRYGCDGEHWSTWYALSPADKIAEGAAATLDCRIELPQGARERYHELMRQWQKTEPQWGSDEDEFCRWIAKTEPEFFQTNFPFLGYVQFRLEHASLSSPLTIAKLGIEMNWGTGGLHTAPRDQAKADYNSKWHFTLPAKP